MEKMDRVSSAHLVKTKIDFIKYLEDNLSARRYDRQLNEMYAGVTVLNRCTQLSRALT